MNNRFDQPTKSLDHSITHRAAQKQFGPVLTGLALAISLSATQPANGASFLVTGSLNDIRAYHTATLLPNGKVLIAGGYYENPSEHYLLRAELYDPAIGTWTATGDLNKRRASHTATLLPSGMVLVAGGEGGNTIKSELYDPATGTWSNTGALKIERSDHTATLLPNGKVLLVGGYGLTNDLSSAEVYDPATEKWTLTGAMTDARAAHTATLLPDGRVLVAGGSGLSSAEIYDPATGTWTNTNPLNTPRTRHTATLLPTGKVLVAGGFYDTGYFKSLASAELYDPAGGTWTNTGSMVTLTPGSRIPGRFDHTATLLASGQVLVIGGDVQTSGIFEAISSAESYDSVTGTWASADTLNTRRASHTATLLPSGEVLVAAGWHPFPGFVATDSAELYVGTLTMINPRKLSNGSFQFSFTSSTGASASVLASTNLMLPLSNWTVLNGVTEISPGHFQFTDTEATNHPERFYRLRSP